MIVIPKRDHPNEQPIGEHSWWIYHHVCESEGIGPFVLHECPNGHVGTLRHLHSGQGHAIAADGTVSPSVVCSYPVEGVEGCGFHDFIQLEGWEP